MLDASANLQAHAVARLRALFPGSRTVRVLDRKLAQAAAVRVAKLTHCSRRACPFPVVAKSGLCRGHLADSTAEYSVLPSALGVATIPQARSSHHAHA